MSGQIEIKGIQDIKKRIEDFDFSAFVYDALETEVARIIYRDLSTHLPADNKDMMIRAHWHDLAFGDKGFYWDKKTARYRDKSTGRLVAESSVLKLGESYVDQVIRPRLTNYTERFIAGDIELADWQQRVQKELKDGWTVQTIIGRGGIKQMTPTDWGGLGGRLNFEYRRLATFAQEIANGQLAIGQITYRVNLYINAVRTAFYDGLTRAKQSVGFTLERRRLNPAEHCGDCVYYASLGWQPIGSLPKPGTESQCQRNCKCNMEYRRESDEQ